MTESIRMMETYFHPLYEYKEAIQDLTLVVKKHNIDTLVGIGLSGALVVPKLAEAVGANWLIIRKEGEITHGTQMGVGVLGERWLFVDDFIATGKSFRMVYKQVNAIQDQGRELASMMEDEPVPFFGRFCGIFTYHCIPEFFSANHHFTILKIKGA